MRGTSLWVLAAAVTAVCACSDSNPATGPDGSVADTGPADVNSMDAKAPDVPDANVPDANVQETSVPETSVPDVPDADPADAPDVSDADPTDAPDVPDADPADAPDVTPDVAPDVTADVAEDRGPQCDAGLAICGERCVDTASDPMHCGACSTACQRGEVCDAGRCELGCPSGQTACSGACVTLATDALHCGACGAACPVGARCEASMCRCPEGQASCGGRCVDTTSSPAHCGGCDRACALASATAACVEGACRVAGCATGRGDCDGMAANGCEVAITTEVAHCGACGRSCAPAHATGTCAMGVCGMGACETGFADCDMSASTGCEVDTRVDPRHCGGCGTVCATGRCADGRCTAPRSCLELKTLQPATADGRYAVDPDGAGPVAPFDVWCDMTTAGGGWTFLATVTNNGDATNAGRWLHTSPTPNAWESTSATFGTLDPARNEDFRSPAFHGVEGRALMVTHRNLPLLFTDDACMQGRTLQASLTRLGWTCGGSENFASHPACTNACVIASATPRAGDTAMLGGAVRARLYLKAGEADGAQDTNRDRAYLSTSYRDNVDYPTGLGAFCSGASCSPRTGEADVNDRSDAITPTAGTEFYGIWIR